MALQSNRGFSNPQVTINNGLVMIKPNSFKYVAGKGDIKVRTVSGGGGSVQSIHTEDVATKVSKFMFEMAVTDSNRTNASNWKDNIGTNVCLATQAGMKAVVGINMSMVNDPEWDASADGWVKIEFSGDPLSEV